MPVTRFRPRLPVMSDPPCLPLIMARPDGARRIERASRHAGAYLDRLRKTELTELRHDEWLELLAIVIACGEAWD